MGTMQAGMIMTCQCNISSPICRSTCDWKNYSRGPSPTISERRSRMSVPGSCSQETEVRHSKHTGRARPQLVSAMWETVLEKFMLADFRAPSGKNGCEIIRLTSTHLFTLTPGQT